MATVASGAPHYAYEQDAKELARLMVDVRTKEREACARVAEACAPAGLSDQWTAAQRAIANNIRQKGTR